MWGRKDVKPDSSSGSGRTRPLLAATNGGEGVVKLLFGRKDVSPGSSNKSSRTPLSLATQDGHDGMVKQ